MIIVALFCLFFFSNVLYIAIYAPGIKSNIRANYKGPEMRSHVVAAADYFAPNKVLRDYIRDQHYHFYVACNFMVLQFLIWTALFLAIKIISYW